MRTRLPSREKTWTDDDARVVLDRWRQSGESVAAFCRKHGLTAERLYWWRKRLVASTPTSTLSLVPATIVTRETTIAIRIPGEVTIEVANASVSWVAALVGELSRST